MILELIKDQVVLIVGLARSGLAAVQLSAELGARKIVVADQKTSQELAPGLSMVQKLPAVIPATGGTPPDLVTSEVSLIIKSPGVPPYLELFRRAEKLGVPVLSEIELAYAFMRAPLIGITGTNGKTTTTMLAAEIIKEARYSEVLTAGNIGVPLCEVARQINPTGIVVAELSSFQLSSIGSFRPLVAVIINFEEDHLDYHGSLDSYFQAKSNILKNQTALDYAVLNAGDPKVASLAGKVRGNLVWFKPGVLEYGFGVQNDQMVLFHPAGVQLICELSEIALPGEHNLENALAAAAACWAAGADLAAVRAVLRRFPGVEHRLEPVACLQGVEFINDSKGTNPGASIRALKSFSGREKILIAGGKDKGGSFCSLAGVIKEEVKSVVLLGETADKIAAALDEVGFKHYRKVKGMAEAVEEAWRQSQPGDMVILSPACASWDMFVNFEERGRLFKQLVSSLSL
ncbi:MAG TPA: UDP-N-acetylmuramoyl-L-alanine--D-glutamate ligase [Firmicutes bacterium]|nr:UDP-N-acetylmuramoyl-L-alanine--D-glutamate ligase [Bacillota bacterium]